MSAEAFAIPAAAEHGLEVVAATTEEGPLAGEALALLRSAEGMAAIAELLLQQGRFEEARALYGEVAAREPDDAAAQRALAALEAETGERERAQSRLRALYARNPTSDLGGSGAPASPLVLKVRGFSGTEIMLACGEAGWAPRLRGGHFSTKYLIEDPDFALRSFTIAGDNLERAGAVPPHDLILNSIADPDVEGASLDSLARYLARHPEAQVINRPERVWETARDRNWQRLEGRDGIAFPRTLRLSLSQAGPEELARLLARLEVACPFIIRKAGTQTGRTTALIGNGEDLAAYARCGLEGDYFAIDYRPLLWRGAYFRKLRLFCIDGTYYPVVCHLDRVWNVHGSNRKEVMRTRPELMAEEKRFLSDWRAYVGAANTRRLEDLAALVGLEFFGIDFTLEDSREGSGGIFIYELNPAMRHSFDHAQSFPYKLPHDRAITAAFTRMIEDRLAVRGRGGTRDFDRPNSRGMR